jgi:hypothetical protein
MTSNCLRYCSEACSARCTCSFNSDISCALLVVSSSSGSKSESGVNDVLIRAVDLLIGRDCLTDGLRARPWPVVAGTDAEEDGRAGLLSRGLRGLELVVPENGFLAGVAIVEDKGLFRSLGSRRKIVKTQKRQSGFVWSETGYIKGDGAADQDG